MPQYNIALPLQLSKNERKFTMSAFNEVKEIALVVGAESVNSFTISIE